MTNFKTPVLIAGTAILIAGGAYFFFGGGQPAEPPVAQQPGAPATAPEAVAPIEHPIPAPPVVEEVPLPSLADSDAFFVKHLGEIFDLKTYGERLLLESVITRFVVIVDNLDRRNLPLRHMLTQPPKGNFMVVKEGEEKLYIDERNYSRYEPLVAMFNTMDVKAFVGLYAKYYPLFQQAYEESGYPNKYFNDRFVKVIDHLMATPKPPNGPIALIQPAVLYQYADPKLEKLSSGQKVLIRMGNKNADQVKAKLLELRKGLTGFARDERNAG